MDDLTAEQETTAAELAQTLGVDIVMARDIVATGAGQGCLNEGPAAS